MTEVIARYARNVEHKTAHIVVTHGINVQSFVGYAQGRY